MRPGAQMLPGMIPTFDWPGEMSPGQLGPMSRVENFETGKQELLTLGADGTLGRDEFVVDTPFLTPGPNPRYLLPIGRRLESVSGGFDGVAVATVGLGMGLSNSPIVIALQNAVGWGQRGIVTSLGQFFRSIGVATVGEVLRLPREGLAQLGRARLER